VLVLPGLMLRAAASGTVKKNRELAYRSLRVHAQSALPGLDADAAGFAVALLSWPLAVLLARDSLSFTFP